MIEGERHAAGSTADRVGRHWVLALMALVAVTFLIRSPLFGYPAIDVDEEFYLLVGDRMLQGAIPYVDIWDRKPPGLFVLYAAIRLLGGEGIIQYQLVASGFVAATAIIIATIARKFAPARAALVPALAYAPALAMSGGQGGQSPVFYNLPMAAAALLIAGLVAVPSAPSTIRWRGAGAMLLVGIALQIKYSALFEGLFFGLSLIWLSWRAAPRRAGLFGDMTLWAGMALLPTLAALGFYTAIGQAPAFLYANFWSIAARGDVPAADQWHGLSRIALRLLPFLVPLLIVELAVPRRLRSWRASRRAKAVHHFALGWLAASLIGVAAFGTFFNHYALPLLPPIAIAAAPAFALRPRNLGALLAAASLLGVLIPYPIRVHKYYLRRGDTAYVRQMAAAITPHLNGGCAYIFYGEPIHYLLTHSCLPTRWAFPFHLSLEREAPALGVDAVTEVRRIIATRPPVVVDRLTGDDGINLPVQAVVRDALARDYVLVFSHQNADPDEKDRDTDRIWTLKPGLRRTP